MPQMVELGRKVSTVHPAPALVQEEPQNTVLVRPPPPGSPNNGDGINQSGNSTRTSSSATSLTVIRQAGSPTGGIELHHEEHHSLQVYIWFLRNGKERSENNLKLGF